MRVLVVLQRRRAAARTMLARVDAKNRPTMADVGGKAHGACHCGRDAAAELAACLFAVDETKRSVPIREKEP